MLVFINQSEYINTAERAGIKVITQQANNAIFGDNMGIELPPGYFASMSMRQVKRIRMRAWQHNRSTLLQTYFLYAV